MSGLIKAHPIEILKLIQRKASMPITELSRRIGISKTPCWNRIRRLEEDGIITHRPTILDRNKLDLPIVVFLSIKLGCG